VIVVSTVSLVDTTKKAILSVHMLS
jgi:hypothetical protein